MIEKNIGFDCDLFVKATEKQLKEIEYIKNFGYTSKNADKYFHIWYGDCGVFIFPKEKYFVSYQNETNYAVAILMYGSTTYCTAISK